MKIAQTLIQPPRAAIIRALRSGLKTPGSIATATKLGATATYQELDRMNEAGLVTMQRDGALILTVADDLETTFGRDRPP